MTIAVAAHKMTKRPMVRPSFRSKAKGVRFRRNATSDSFAKHTLVIDIKLAAYCAYDMSGFGRFKNLHDLPSVMGVVDVDPGNGDVGQDHLNSPMRW